MMGEHTDLDSLHGHSTEGVGKYQLIVREIQNLKFLQKKF